jgi:arylsulfatase
MASSRPNILWYCTDQQRFDTIGALGNRHVHTPNLDQLVRDGVAFTHAYCQSPICTPSRASFLTGRYPSTIGINTNGNSTFPAHERLVTRRLADTGYDAGLVGKLHLAGAYNGREARVDDGYDFFRYSHAPRDDWKRGHDYADWIRKKGEDPGFYLNKPSQSYGVDVPSAEHDNVPSELHQTTWCSEQAIQYIQGDHEGPWILSVNPYDPHPPYNPPWEYFRRYDPNTLPGPHFRQSDLAHQAKLAGTDFQTEAMHPDDFDGNGGRTAQALYYAMIEQIDDQFGRILEALERTGLRENTVIIFMSDHGEALGDHGLAHKGARFFDGLTRVPMIWSWPQHFKSGVVSTGLVSLLDVAPTLMELVGLPIPARMQGRSLLPILTGDASPDHHHAFVRCEYRDAVDLPHRTHATMYRDLRWKLITYHGLDYGELYDLDNDPHEFNNLWDAPAYSGVKTDLLIKSYDASVEAMDYGEQRVMPY